MSVVIKVSYYGKLKGENVVTTKWAASRKKGR